MPTLLSLLPSDLARTRGGAERYAFELHRALAEELSGWRLRGLVAMSRQAGVPVPAGWSVVSDPCVAQRPAGDAIGLTAVVRQAMLGDVDVVVCHGWRTRVATALRLGARLHPRLRLACMDHGSGTRLGYLLSGMPLPAADVAAHQSVFESGVSPVKGRRHALVRGGIDERRFRPGNRAPDRDFLMVGRFLPYKGQLSFLECLPEGASAELVGPADSEDPAYLRAVLDKAAERGVAVRFDVSDDQLARSYQAATYTVQVPVDPRRRYQGAAPPELLGLTMLEAMACGSIPICPVTGASAEFVREGETGLTYEAGSRQALRTVLQRALRRQEVARLRANAIQEARQWTWASAARSLAAALGLASSPHEQGSSSPAHR